MESGRIVIVLLDGPSGAGKSTLADRTAAVWREAGITTTLVRMDDIYPGWHGLRQASDSVVATLLAPFARGQSGGWRSWDWDAERSGPWRTIPPGGVLLLEGCGSLSRASAPLADFRVWLDAEDEVRKRRALGRDGELFTPWWETWQKQFDEFVAREHPRESADLILDGSAAGSDRLAVPFPGYGGNMTTPASETHYRVEFIDGPLAGQTEDRLLVNGEYDREFTTYAAVESLESAFVYHSVEDREIDGQLHVRYSFDAADSDPVQGDEDEGDSLTI